MKNHNRLGLAFIIIGLVVMFFLVYLVFFRSDEKMTENNTDISGQTGQLPSGTGETGTTTVERERDYSKYDISRETPKPIDADSLSKQAMAFSERFGSFSNQSNYGNFTDLQIFMTDTLREWTDGYVEKLRQESKASGYYGITTRALSAEAKSFDDKAGTAQIIVTTERSESTETIGGGVPYIQKLDVRYLKVNGSWLVDAVYWDK